MISFDDFGLGYRELNWLSHVGFGMLGCSYLMKQMWLLRLCLVCANLMLVVWGFVALAGGAAVSVVAWNSLFMSINLRMMVGALRARRQAPVPQSNPDSLDISIHDKDLFGHQELALTADAGAVVGTKLRPPGRTFDGPSGENAFLEAILKVREKEEERMEARRRSEAASPSSGYEQAVVSLELILLGRCQQDLEVDGNHMESV